jgi:hypothetical protein
MGIVGGGEGVRACRPLFVPGFEVALEVDEVLVSTAAGFPLPFVLLDVEALEESLERSCWFSALN